MSSRDAPPHPSRVHHDSVRAQVIRPPRMFVTDVFSCAWLSSQMDPDKTVLMIDEPTMGADQGNGQVRSLTRL